MSDLRSLPFELDESVCDPALVGKLEISVSELCGRRSVVAPGEPMVLRGTCRCREAPAGMLVLSGHGRFQGKPAALQEGETELELSADPLEVESGKESILDVLLIDGSGADFRVCLRLNLRRE
jgi:hypothetical protein